MAQSPRDDDWHNVKVDRSEEELRPALVSRSDIFTNSPSRRDGMSAERERSLRIRHAAFIQEASKWLELPSPVMCTAVHYFHRFYSKCSFTRHSPVLTARTCLFLATKVEENARRIRDILNVTYRLQNPDKDPLKVSEQYWKLKESVVLAEQLLLRVLGFNLTSRHPHHYVLHFLKELGASEELAVLSWSILNDSYRTTVCLQFKPESIACAAVYLAAEMMTYQISREGEWWVRFGAHRLEIEDICNQILDLYDSVDSLLCEAQLAGRPFLEHLSQKALLAEPARPQGHAQPRRSSPRRGRVSNHSTPELRPTAGDTKGVPQMRTTMGGLAATTAPAAMPRASRKRSREKTVAIADVSMQLQRPRKRHAPDGSACDSSAAPEKDKPAVAPPVPPPPPNASRTY